MDLSYEQRQKLASVAQDLGIVFVVVFGSVVRGEARPDSDLDIAVMTDRTPDYALFGNAFQQISDVFRGKNVDVRFLNDADPLFTMQVVRDGILLYGDPDVYDEVKMLANRRYVDDGVKYFPMQNQLLHEQQQRLEATAHA